MVSEEKSLATNDFGVFMILGLQKSERTRIVSPIMKFQQKITFRKICDSMIHCD